MLLQNNCVYIISRCLLEELMHTGFGGDQMNTLLFGEEKKE
jgi:hypothetical protein